MFYKNHKQIIILVFISILLAFFSVHHWFQNGYILYYWDTNLPLDIKNTFTKFFYSWFTIIFPGGPQTGAWSLLPYWAIISLVHKFSSSISIAQRIVYTVLLFTSLVSFYSLLSYLAEHIIGKEHSNILRLGNFLFAIFYTFNLYTFYYAYFMFNPDAFLIAFLPLNILALLKIYPLTKTDKPFEKKWIFVFFTSLILMVSGFASYVFLAQYFIWITFYLLFYIIILKKKIISLFTFSVALFLFLIVLSQWWWFFPALLTFNERYLIESSLGTTIWFEGGIKQSQLLNSIRLLGIPLAISNSFSWSSFYSDKLFTFPLFFIPFLILYLVRRIKELKHKGLIVYLLLIFLLSLFLVKYSNPPFAYLLRFAFDNIPFFGAFRDAYHKTGIYFIFAYFLLSGLGFYLINKSLLERQKRFLLLLLFTAVLIAGIVVTGPYFLFFRDNIIKLNFIFDNKTYTISAKTKIPPEYYDLKTFFASKCSGKATLIIPRGGWISSAIWPKYNSSYVGIDLIPQLIDCEFITTVIFPQEPELSNQSAYVLLDQGDIQGFKNFLLRNQIGYLIVRKDNVPYAPTNWMYVDPEKVKIKVEKDQDFQRIYQNDFFLVYQFKPLNAIDNYGFALPSQVIYTDFTFTKNLDFATLVKQMSPSIGSVILNTTGYYKKFNSSIDSFLSSAKCIDCASEQKNSENKTVSREIAIYRDGLYKCEANKLDIESKITSFEINNNGEKISSTESTEIFLSQGTYPVQINYSTKHVADLPSMEFKKGEYVIIPLGKITEGDYRLTYEVENKDQDVEVLLSKSELSSKEMKIRKYGEEKSPVVFTIPLSLSKKDNIVDRTFTVNYWTNDSYFLYLNAPKSTSVSKNKALFKNLSINKVIKPEDMIFSCGLEETKVDTTFTREMKVYKESPVLYKVVFPEDFHNGFLTLNKSFDDKWIAYSVENGKKHIYNHVKSGYANAWYVNSLPNREIVVEYTMQELIEKNAILSLIVFISILFVYLQINKKNEKTK